MLRDNDKAKALNNGLDFDSSAIQSIRYDGRGNAKVAYTSAPNKEYDFPMTDKEFQAFENAPSKGQFMYYEAGRY